MPLVCKQCGAVVGDLDRRCPDCRSTTLLTTEQAMDGVAGHVFVIVVLIIIVAILTLLVTGPP